MPFGPAPANSGSLAAMIAANKFWTHPLLGLLSWPQADSPLKDLSSPPQMLTTGRMFNALHMSLIPKGPNRGKVLVWNDKPIIADGEPFATGVWWSFQAWSIVDPSPPPLGVQFQNFMLPIEATPVSAGVPISSLDLFCSGHAWTPFGDLIVVGGTTWSVLGILGAVRTYGFNPDLPTAQFPGAPTALYPGFGAWVEGDDLSKPRWYPTVTLTAPIPRLALANPTGGEVMICSGGSLNLNAPANDPTHNQYEALEITGGVTATSSGYVVDVPASPVFNGPGSIDPEVDWLLEYPRMHQLSDGTVFYSGYATRGARLDHEIPGSWDPTPQQTGGGLPEYSSNWGNLRHDGSSILLPNTNGIGDVVMRIGGGDDSANLGGVMTTTPTTEVSVGGGPWTSTPPMPATDGAPTGGRMFTNVVALPTGAILVLGGVNEHFGTTHTTSPLIYVDGQWHVDAPNPFLYGMPRAYHSTAVLLPDGRVFVGGGDNRLADYEIYSPYYLQLPGDHKPTGVNFQQPGAPFNFLYDAWDLDYGQQYGMIYNIGADAVDVDKVVLIAPASMTHHSDMHARNVELNFRIQATGQLAIKAPATKEIAPRGLYMLFMVSTTGGISTAIWVRLS